jgi:hypothetical protein
MLTGSASSGSASSGSALPLPATILIMGLSALALFRLSRGVRAAR